MNIIYGTKRRGKENVFLNSKKEMLNKLQCFFWYLVMSLLAGMVIAFITSVDFSVVENLEENSYPIIQYTDANSFVLFDCRFTEKGIITEGNDPRIELRNVGEYVDYLEVELAKPISCSWKMKIYYREEGSAEYSEECSVSRWVSKYEKRILMPIQRSVQELRIDLGDEEDLLFPVCSVTINPSQMDYFKSLVTEPMMVKGILYSLGIFIVALMLTKQISFCTFYDYRWYLGGVALVICVLLKLNGSSLAYYNLTLPGYDYIPLWGEMRGVRSDEFNIFTQMAFSQVAADFPWFSDLYRMTPMDMVLIYGQAVKDPVVMLFRPFQIGYIFFGAERGLSFYWYSRAIVLFLVSIEFGKLITKKQKKLSVAYALLVSLAPVVQWWYSTNCLLEMLIYGQGVVILLSCFLKNPGIKRKILLIGGMVICSGGFILSMYPAWEIPFFYIFLICAVCVIISKMNEGDLIFTKRDALLISGGLLIVAMGVSYIFLKSYDTIIAETNTVYPGNRNIFGGNLKMIDQLFKSWSNLFLPFTEESLQGNTCESAGFYDFFPMGIVLGIAGLIKRRKKDIWIILLGLLDVILLSFVLCQWPEVLAKITLLNNCTIGRITVAVGFLNLILLFRALDEWETSLKLKTAGCMVLIIIVCYFNYKLYKEYLNENLKLMVMLLAAIVCIMFFFYGRLMEKYIFALCAVIACVSGLTVNPVNFGADAIFDNAIVRNIGKINDKYPGRWVVNTNWTNNNLPTTVGASVLNSIQTYPDYQLWERLNLENEETIWNRYAHFKIEISEKDLKEPKLELVQTDMVQLTVDLDMLRDLDVDYILTKQALNADNVTELYRCEGFYIFAID